MSKKLYQVHHAEHNIINGKQKCQKQETSKIRTATNNRLWNRKWWEGQKKCKGKLVYDFWFSIV